MNADPNWFPDPQSAAPDGLVAVGGDLSIGRLLAAYRNGIFPWSVDPITWWSPDPRGVIELGRLHVSGSLRKTLRRQPYQVTIDRNFEAVIRACKEAPGRCKSWISPKLMRAYLRLHQEGHAHSVEAWQGDVLVGGVYGVAVGGLFAGESMFHRADDASKIALVFLEEHLRLAGFEVFDVQMVTPVTSQMGAREVARKEYLQKVKATVGRNVVFPAAPLPESTFHPVFRAS
jgi:leucyl/phenylalanyl-tRNA--protein transferase